MTKDKYKAWFEQGLRDLKAAKNSYTTKDYDWASFQAQQAAEKIIKYNYLLKFNKFKKLHDLVYFARELELPEDITEACARLTRVYIETRYPDTSSEIPAKKFTKTDAEFFINLAEKIIKWLQKNL